MRTNRYSEIFNLLLLLSFAFLTSLSASDSVLDFFSKDSIEANSFSSNEGLLSSIIGNHVSAISGEYVDNATDCCLAGPEPLMLQRSYSSNISIGMFGYESPNVLDPEVFYQGGSKYCGWQFNHLTRLHFQFDLRGHARHAEFSAFVPHAFFSQMLHHEVLKVPEGEYQYEDCSLHLSHQKGVTNCSMGAMSGKTNPKNVIVNIINKHDNCEVKFGSGHTRSYKGRLIDYFPGEVAVFRYNPISETKANGNQIIYENGKVSIYNKTKSTLFSSLTFHQISKKELKIETSHSDPITYHFDQFDVYRSQKSDRMVRYYLTKLEMPDKAHETYKYQQNATKFGWLLTHKDMTNGRFLEIDYYALGDNPGEILKLKITNDLDPRIDRIKCLKAPVGHDQTPIVTHSFYYDLNSKVNHKKHKSKFMDGQTTVYDALNNKTIYSFNEYHRLKKVTHYVNKKPYVVTKYLWHDIQEEIDYGPLGTDIIYSSDQGNLMGKVIRDGKLNILNGRFFTYDKKGNILKENFYGNLTGNNSKPILLKEFSPIDNGAEHYERSFEYSNDSYNHLLKEKEQNGRTLRYTYVPDSDLISSKFLMNRDLVCAREFYEYDVNNALMAYISDNGSEKEKNNLKNVTERHITRYQTRKAIPVGFPEQIDELIIDSKGREKLLKRTTQVFSLDGKLLNQTIYDSDGQYRYTKSWEYDKHGNNIKEVNPLGHEIIRRYDDHDNLIYEQGPSLDYWKEHTYDFANRLIKTEEIHSSGERFSTLYRYDYAGNCISKIDRYGNETSYEYDELNRLIKTNLPPVAGEKGITIKIAYDCLGNQIEEVDARGAVTKKTYNSRGKATSIIYPDGQLESFEYALDGTPVKKIGSNGVSTYFEVDCFGRILTEKIYSATKELLYASGNKYDSLHKTSSTDSAGITTYYEYDRVGRLNKTTCLDKITLYEYDTLGRVVKKKEPFGKKVKVTCSEYDLLDRVIEERIEDELGNILRKSAYQYDRSGNRTHVIEETEAGISTHITLYNSDKKPIKSIDPDNHETKVTYNYAFWNEEHSQYVLQTTTTDSLGRQTVITYDSWERPVSITKHDPFGLLIAKQELYYDKQNNLAKVIDYVIIPGKDTNTIETVLEHDNMSRLTSLIQAKGHPEQQRTHIKYNKFGQKETVVKGDGILLIHTYDDLGRLKTYRSSDNTISYRYTYNSRNQPLKIEDLNQKTSTQLDYDLKGHLIKETLPTALALSYEYDSLDRVTSLILPDQSRINYQYDSANLTLVEKVKNQKIQYMHRYDKFDLTGLNLKATSIDQKENHYTYDLSKRPLVIEINGRKQNSNSYDAVGRLIQTDVQDPIDTYKLQYGYDDLDHLISEQGFMNQTFSCDSLHNRLSKDQIIYQSNALHQLLSNGDYSYTYDPSGNLIKKEKLNEKATYSYDAADRLISVNSGIETRYQYDSFNRRVAKIEGNKTTRYLYVGQDEIGAVDENGKIIELRVLGLGHGAEIGAAIAIELNDKVYAPTHDFKGNIVALSDLTGNPVEIYRYSAFGETSIFNPEGQKLKTSAIGNPWQFSSKRADLESGFIYFGRRYYDPINGRWITSDPNGLSDGPNLYAYLHHHPINAFDLYGLQEEAAADQEPYYPLQNVDYHDSPSNSPPPEDALPNETPLGFIEKKTGKKDRFFFFGTEQIYELGISYANGMMNSFKDACKSANELSKMASDHFVTLMYNRSKGFIFTDLVRCFFELYFYMETKAVVQLRQKWDAYFSVAGPNAMLYHQCHSEGTIVTRNALMGYPEEYRKRMIIDAFAPGGYIPKKLAFQVTHYRSTRDIVPLLDFVGRYRCRETTIVLKPHADAPFYDHGIDSPTYRDIRQDNISIYTQTYGKVCT